MSDPNETRGISVTLKAPESKRYANDNPWLVFHGTVASVREQIIEAFNMADTEGLTLADLACNAQQQFTAVRNAGMGLGGTVVASGRSAGPAWEDASTATEKAPEKTPDEVEIERLLGAIEKCTTVDEVKDVWARNEQRLFNENEPLMSAWKAKGKALRDAASA